MISEGSIRFNHVVHRSCVNTGGREWDGGSFFYLLLALGLGATIEKEHAVPREGRAKGPTEGRRPCARVAREGELSLVRALTFRSYHLI